MYTLQIEHRVCDFDSWKNAFDNYNHLSAQACVCRYRIFRSLDNPNYVMVDLDFEHSSEAHFFIETMQQVWERVEGKLVDRPQIRIVEALERKEYSVQHAA
jgi:quinol monooxygenase YgiN